MSGCNKTDMAALLLLGLLGSFEVSAESPPTLAAAMEEIVPLYSPQDAWRLALAPESRMVDDETCERIEGHIQRDEHGVWQVVAGGKGALFRTRRQRTPFMWVEARSDGVFVARFPARPNEVIYARGYVIDSRTKRYVYGEPTKSICGKGSTSIGDLELVQEVEAD